MPTYNVHYFIVKPLYIPWGTAPSGSTARVSPFDPSKDPIRQQVLQVFETNLRDYFRAAARTIDARWDVAIHRIQEASPGIPNFSGVQIAARDPIIYLTARETDSVRLSDSNPQDVRIALHITDEIGDNFEDVPRGHMRRSRRTLESAHGSGGEDGFASHWEDLFPCSAEVFVNPAIQYENERIIPFMGDHLARIAYHEVAHVKCECQNRSSPSGQPWSAAISVDIHSTSGLTSSPPAFEQTDADKRLMAQHMMVPVPFYKLGMPIDDQFFSRGSQQRLARRGQADDSPSETPRQETVPDLDAFDPDALI